MSITIGNKPIVTIAPRCPSCTCADTQINRSQGIYVEHQGERCRAQKQYRTCRECGRGFGVIHIKGPERALKAIRNAKPPAAPSKAATRRGRTQGNRNPRKKSKR